jgi:hypothetical protein
MNLRRILSLVLVGVLFVSVLSFTGCDVINGLIGGGETPDGPAGGSSTLVMEAEYVDIDDVAGAGISNNNSGLSMIYGDGTDAQKEMWSEGYYVGYTHNDQTELTFKFTASKATTANVVISLGSELIDITLNQDSFAVIVNGEEQYIPNWYIEKCEMDAATFVDCRLSAPVNLVEGENTIVLKVLANDLGGKGVTRGPLIDYVKVTATDAKLEWTPKTDNPYRRDNEV